MKILWSVLLPWLLVPGWSGEPRLPAPRATSTILAEPVALYPLEPARRKLGSLSFLGGVRLTGNDPSFGSYSGMIVTGDRFTLLSDGGSLVSFRMDGHLRPSEARFGEFPAGPGTGWRKLDRDSESISRDPATGRIWVGFERANAIWRYSAHLSRVEGSTKPPTMAHWGLNSGPEALVRLRGGGTIVIRERGSWRKGPARPAIFFSGDPVEAPRRGFAFGYLPPAGFSPVDIAELPDGRLLVLDRALRLPIPFVARLSLVDPRGIRPGATVAGREIARFEPPALAENFEAVAVSEEGGKPVVWIASDDNQFFFQRTLLLKFRLES